MNFMTRLAFGTLQFCLAILRIPFAYLAQWFGAFSHSLLRAYYWCVVRRRRAAGEPEWKEIDLQIGRQPPPGHTYWDSLPTISAGPPIRTMRFTKHHPDVACGKLVKFTPESGAEAIDAACSRVSDHPPPCEAMACDAYALDGVHGCCRQPNTGDHAGSCWQPRDEGTA